MTRREIDRLLVLLVVGGGLAGFAVVAWLAWQGTGEGALAAVVGLATILLQMAGNIVRNRFPGPEIDVLPQGYTPPACTCGDDKRDERGEVK